MLDELGPESQMPGGKPFPMKIEPWPGGRWYRDLGNNSGHLWGHVQVIKPPTLLEICGPLMMSYPAANHLQYRFKAEGGVTRLVFLHRAMGLILPEHRAGLPKGWAYSLSAFASWRKGGIGSGQNDELAAMPSATGRHRLERIRELAKRNIGRTVP